MEGVEGPGCPENPRDSLTGTRPCKRTRLEIGGPQSEVDRDGAGRGSGKECSQTLCRAFVVYFLLW
jgi:hypothetical protein